MIIVAEVVIEDEVPSATFCCDVQVCKGACCSLAGGRGAPLEDSEVAEIEKAYPLIRSYLSETSVRTIETEGLVEGGPGDYATVCVNNRECVFAYFEDGIARCALERAHLEGLTKWRKPLSCHLFPVRIRRFGRDFIRYEQIEECKAGRERGLNEQIKLHEFLKIPLSRKYGDPWYDAFHERCSNDPPDLKSC